MSCVLGSHLAGAQPVATPPSAIPASLLETEMFYKEIYARVAPSVVHISTKASLGSGFFVTDNGLILTNKHVVGKEKNVKVVLIDGRIFQGEVVESGRDDLDVALVRIELNAVRALPFADPAKMTIGSWTGAIGHARNLGWTFTHGIISNIHRSNNYAMIQMQTPINPGNSGGPLFNLRGEVIGVNTFKINESEGLNFSIRIDAAMQSLNGLLPFCGCFIVETEEETPVFVNGKMAGTGKRVLVKAEPGSYKVFTVQNGARIEKVVKFPKTHKVELKP
jgi:S1-C subfamily serine protease